MLRPYDSPVTDRWYSARRLANRWTCRRV